MAAAQGGAASTGPAGVAATGVGEAGRVRADIGGAQAAQSRRERRSVSSALRLLPLGRGRRLGPVCAGTIRRQRRPKVGCLPRGRGAKSRGFGEYSYPDLRPLEVIALPWARSLSRRSLLPANIREIALEKEIEERPHCGDRAERPNSSAVGAIIVSMTSAASWKLRPTTSQHAKSS
jgi:hypothetical protein